VLFILEDVPSRCVWFRESDWRESRLELEKYIAEYGELPEWEKYLQGLSLACDMGLTLTNLSAAQTANPRALRSWPNPGAMVSYGISPNTPLPPVSAFMKYLNDFFYVDLSQQAKLGGTGMPKRGASHKSPLEHDVSFPPQNKRDKIFLLDEIRSLPGTAAQIKKYTYAQVGQAVALILALASEIEAHFNFGLRQDALAVWNIALPVIVVVKEVYEKRYRTLLG
jgi:hypothetical protein